MVASSLLRPVDGLGIHKPGAAIHLPALAARGVVEREEALVVVLAEELVVEQVARLSISIIGEWRPSYNNLCLELNTATDLI